MSRVLLSAILLSILGLGAATPAFAKIDPVNCEAPGLITLVARGADGTADPIGTFTVFVRDFNNVPSENEMVSLDFQNCPDIRLCIDQDDPRVTVDCAGRSVSARTGPDGAASFRVIGCAVNQGSSPGAIAPTLIVFAEGVYITTARVAALDQNGGGVDGSDLSMVLDDYFSGQPFARSDYDGNGVLTGNDLSLWLAAYFKAGSAVSGGAACP